VFAAGDGDDGDANLADFGFSGDVLDDRLTEPLPFVG
jgi:hypothetical protein